MANLVRPLIEKNLSMDQAMSNHKNKGEFLWLENVRRLEGYFCIDPDYHIKWMGSILEQ